MIVALVMVALTPPELVKTTSWYIGSLPPQSAGPKSIGPVGHPAIWPYPTEPANESEDTLVPQVVPLTLTVADALTDAVVVAAGVKPAVTATAPPAASVVGVPPVPVPERENSASDGGPKETLAGALPVLTR